MILIIILIITLTIIIFKYFISLYFKKTPLNLNDGDIILITGGNGGLGSQLIINISKSYKNITILSLDIDDSNNNFLSKICLSNNIKYVSITTDISNYNTLKETLDKIKLSYGIPKVIINNAAIAPMINFNELSFEIYHKTISINSLAPVFIVKYFYNDMITDKNKKFLIVNISSVVGYIPGSTGNSYVSSKHMLNGFHNSLRAELKSKKISNIDMVLAMPYAFDSELFKTLKRPSNIILRLLIRNLSLESVGKYIFNGIINKDQEINLPFYFRIINSLLTLLGPDIYDIINNECQKGIFNNFKNKYN